MIGAARLRMAVFLLPLAVWPVLGLAQVAANPADRLEQLSIQAAQGKEHAYFPLARMHAYGDNLIEAYVLAEIASVVLSDVEDVDKPKAAALKAELAQRMSPDEIARALGRARELRPDLEQVRERDARALSDLKGLVVFWAVSATVGAALGLALRRVLFERR